MRVLFRDEDFPCGLPTSGMNALAIGVCHDLAGKETRVNRSLSILQYDNALAKRSGIAGPVFADHHRGILCQ